MKNKLAVLLCSAFLLLSAGKAAAVPTLQLDILGGTYDPVTETIVASSSTFQLYAYLIPNSRNPIGDTYSISAALVPQTVPPGGSLGSFMVNGTTIGVTSGMYYGIPPLEAYLAPDPGDLPPHGIFQTYFREFSFQFSPSNRAAVYNTQDNPGTGPTSQSNGGMYYQMFTIDTSLLAAGYAIHFDLYNTIIGSNPADVDISQFAPFSHDAESRRVPEASTLFLLGAGLVAGVALVARRK